MVATIETVAEGQAGTTPAAEVVPEPKRLRVLFAMHYPGYLRYFDSAVEQLAERGHDVRLVFDKPAKQSEGLVARVGGARIVDDGRFVRREDLWSPLAMRIRRLIDYTRYLHPDFATAQPLRRRIESILPRPLRILSRVPSLGPARFRVLLRILYFFERALPSGSRIESFLASAAPDVVVVSPLVAHAARQTDLVKSARALGIPTVLAVGSWDHLTTKGLMRIVPDRVIVWNARQRSEAVRMHGVPESRIVVTGAQPFDRWFGCEPTTSKEDFCRKVGLPPEKRFILFVGSTATISAPAAEQDFVRRWVQAMRTAPDPALRELGVLVRPHPYNPGLWREADLSDLGDVVAWPRAGANPVDEADRRDYFDSMAHSAAVVGVNTSAMIEAAIVGRPVHTILDDEFGDTQGGTLHFRYLLPENGGFLRVATSLEEHLGQLGDTLRNRGEARTEIERFVGSFVRPHGVDRACTPIFADAIESVATLQTTRERYGPVLRAVRGLLWLAAWGLWLTDRRNLARGLRKLYGSGSLGRRRLARLLRARSG